MQINALEAVIASNWPQIYNAFKESGELTFTSFNIQHIVATAGIPANGLSLYEREYDRALSADLDKL